MPAPSASGSIVGGLVEIRTTFGSRDVAIACAERLVAGRMAACVQVDGPIMSIYSWQGVMERAEEWRCLVKTTYAAREACITAILSGHAYETPQVAVVPLEATAAYAAWVIETVRLGPNGGL